MDQKLKQRLVGAFVIISLAVIFLPMLLDGAGAPQQSLEISLPEPPLVIPQENIKQKVIELNRKVEEIPELKMTFVDEDSEYDLPRASTQQNSNKITTSEPVKPPQQNPVVEKETKQPEIKASAKTPDKKEIEAPKIEKDKTPAPAQGKTWVVQVGSFNDRDKAFAQRDRLRKSKIAPVFIENYTHGGQLKYRVRMGPFVSRKEAKVIINKLYAKYSIQAIIMSFQS